MSDDRLVICDTVELFAGIGGFRLAAEMMGIRTLWANDICPKACQVYRSRFSDDVLHQGDIRELVSDIPRHDLLTAGFPCQPFSSAGKKRGLGDPRGSLFATIVDVLSKNCPRYFILENVKRLLSMERGQHFATMLSCLVELGYQVEWRLINAMHFGLPQNRQRLILVGSLDTWDTFPVIRLASSDDLHTVFSENFTVIKNVSAWDEIAQHAGRFANWGLACEGRFFAANLRCFSEAKTVLPLRQVLQPEVDPSFDFTANTRERLKESVHVNKFIDGIQILYNQGGGARMGYTIFGIDGVAPTLTSTTSRHYERYKVADHFRRLTNVEYARLQGFPDNHCEGVSIYDQYPLYGNAIPPALACWAMHKILAGSITIPKGIQYQSQLFSTEAVNDAC